jgi:putative endonuclease
MTNFTNKVLYTGLTNNLERRVAEHKAGNIIGFTQKYNINKLVYYELGDYVHSAISREKELKGWSRAKKIRLIESFNPDWKDFSLELFE